MLKMLVLTNYSKEGQQYVYIKMVKKLENHASMQAVGTGSYAYFS